MSLDRPQMSPVQARSPRVKGHQSPLLSCPENPETELRSGDVGPAQSSTNKGVLMAEEQRPDTKKLVMSRPPSSGASGTEPQTELQSATQPASEGRMEPLLKVLGVQQISCSIPVVQSPVLLPCCMQNQVIHLCSTQYPVSRNEQGRDGQGHNGDGS